MKNEEIQNQLKTINDLLQLLDNGVTGGQNSVKLITQINDEKLNPLGLTSEEKQLIQQLIKLEDNSFSDALNEEEFFDAKDNALELQNNAEQENQAKLNILQKSKEVEAIKTKLIKQQKKLIKQQKIMQPTEKKIDTNKAAAKETEIKQALESARGKIKIQKITIVKNETKLNPRDFIKNEKLKKFLLGTGKFFGSKEVANKDINNLSDLQKTLTNLQQQNDKTSGRNGLYKLFSLNTYNSKSQDAINQIKNSLAENLAKNPPENPPENLDASNAIDIVKTITSSGLNDRNKVEFLGKIAQQFEGENTTNVINALKNADIQKYGEEIFRLTEELKDLSKQKDKDQNQIANEVNEIKKELQESMQNFVDAGSTFDAKLKINDKEIVLDKNFLEGLKKLQFGQQELLKDLTIPNAITEVDKKYQAKAEQIKEYVNYKKLDIDQNRTKSATEKLFGNSTLSKLLSGSIVAAIVVSAIPGVGPLIGGLLIAGATAAKVGVSVIKNKQKNKAFDNAREKLMKDDPEYKKLAGEKKELQKKKSVARGFQFGVSSVIGAAAAIIFPPIGLILGAVLLGVGTILAIKPIGSKKMNENINNKTNEIKEYCKNKDNLKLAKATIKSKNIGNYDVAEKYKEKIAFKDMVKDVDLADAKKTGKNQNLVITRKQEKIENQVMLK